MILMNYVYENNDETLKKYSAKKDDGSYYSFSSLSRYINDINRIYDQAFIEDKRCFVQIYEVDPDSIMLICSFKAEKISIDECETTICKFLNNAKCIRKEEISIDTFKNNLYRGNRNDFLLSSVRSCMEKLEINIVGKQSIYDELLFTYDERIFERKLLNKKQCLNKAKEIMASESLIDEINRIYSNKNEKKFYGHPIHYYISASSWDAANDIINVLLGALLKNNRLISKRTASLRNISPRAYNEPTFENVFASAVNSSLVIDLSGEKAYGNYANATARTAELISKKVKLYGNYALFFFVEIFDKMVYKDEFLAEILSNTDIVKIEEGYGTYDSALNYLNDLVEKSDFSNYKENDMEKYLPDKISFSVSDVYEAYDKWYGRGLKTHIYKAYKELESVKIVVKKKEAEPYKKLQEMIGLKQIKDVTDQIIEFSKVQKRRKELGLNDKGVSRHMLFYGNPGTAKSTVARLLSQILKSEGVLENGHIVECGRQDLVARWVGWTAKTVEEKFESARGGILFIDEAYSLLEGYNSFGTEAINTIVQLMENYRDDVIVIFAGYPEKMKDFINKNEGLASRIGFQLDFPDYDENELLKIMELMLKEHQYTMSTEAKNKCLSLFKEASLIPNFGNGRFVRNVLEQIELKQAKRISLQYKGKEIGKKQISNIEVEDIIDDYKMLINKKNDLNTIGYIA